MLAIAKPAPPALTFKPVRGRPDRMAVIQRAFSARLEPLYGCQASAMQKIEDGRDRTCRLAYDEQTACGLVVFKDALSDEYRTQGVSRSLEVKSLFLIEPTAHSGRGYGTALLDYILAKAEDMGAESVHLTVSEKVPESRRFFEKHGFTVVEAFPDCYIRGVTEYLMCLRLRGKKRALEEAPRPAAAATRRPTPPPPSHGRPPRVFRVTLRRQYIDVILQGKKTIEGRINAGMFAQVRPGDTLDLYDARCPSVRAVCTVTAVTPYDSWRAMLSGEGVAKCLPGVASIEAGVRIYANLPGYEERARRHGVLALALRVQ